MADDKKVISLKEVVGGGYSEFWNCTKRYCAIKGSRASKKSTTIALRWITKIMQHPDANLLVVRQVAATLKDSCYAQLLWAISRLGVEKFWKARVSPLELEYIPTGQKILFRGCDDGMKITSITVKKGILCWLWVEEAFELEEDTFNRIDESLRGQLPEGLFIQCVLSFNPWQECWLKHRFFDIKDESILALTTTYKCNEWLSESDLKMFETMKRTDPQRYRTAGLGEWGLMGTQFFSQFDPAIHVVEPFEIPAHWVKIRGMDWGSAAPSSVLWAAVDYDGNIFIYRELYTCTKPNVGTGETAREVAIHITELEPKDEKIDYAVLDSACWARTGVTGPCIAEEINMTLWEAGLQTFGKCSKGRVEAANAIKQRLLGREQKDGTYKPALYIFSNCYHLIRCLPLQTHDKHNPETYDTKGEDHCIDSLAYILLSRPWSPVEIKDERKPRSRYSHKETTTTSAWVT